MRLTITCPDNCAAEYVERVADLPHTRASLIAILDGYADGDGLHMPDAFRDMTRELRDAQ